MYVQREDGLELSDDPARLDLDLMHQELSQTYWSPGLPRSVMERAVSNSWCFGLYKPEVGQIGFARLVTDHATFAYLADVFVLSAYRGGTGRWMMDQIFALPELAHLRRIMLATRDAHSLYAGVGFEPLAAPETFMQIVRPDIYSSPTKSD